MKIKLSVLLLVAFLLLGTSDAYAEQQPKARSSRPSGTNQQDSETVASDAPALKDLLPLMQKDAALYDNIETRYTMHIVSPQLGPDGDPSHVTRWLKETYGAVWQGSLFHCKYHTEFELYNGSKKEFDTEYGYDNEFTRVNYQGSIGNIDDRRQEPFPFCPPHHLGMPELGEHELSDFLQLSPTVKLTPRLSRIRRMEPTVEGTVAVEGLKCIKIKCDAFVDDGKVPRSRYLFWIAPLRNYLIVRSEHYLVSASLEVPLVEYKASDWRELAAGIWVPFRCSATLHQVSTEKKPKEWDIVSTTTYVVESANLTPKHAIDFFRNVEMPKDAPVYILKGGEIVETRINGVIEGDGNPKN